ncbi:hypothetical protein ABT297_16340 [Dactylosporangium sp. NPDC000555]|uniref:LppU/SCO3897 family protein n=1 Tax=Dactylosporangium sp. NPDC000555 TaxID=3154260 RepID=UPI00333327A6
MSDQYPPPGSYPPPGGGGYPPPGGDQPPAYGPPASGAPYGQPSSGGPYGPPTSGSPYGQPPAYGAPAPGAPGAPFGAPPPPPKKSSAGKIILIILGVILVLVLVCCGATFLFAKDTWNDLVDNVKTNPAMAKVGDCLAGDDITEEASKSVDVKIVKCDDSTAKYKVLGIPGGVSKADALAKETKVCAAYPDTQYVLWQGTDVKDGSALCLEDAK